jgi:tRNA(His) guanylyltransferase
MSLSLEHRLLASDTIGSRELTKGRPLVARVIGRRFDQLLDGASFERPYDAQFGKAMVKTASYLASVLGASFAYCERAELSLYAVANGGDSKRLLSRIIGEASGKLSLLLGEVATFECRLYECEGYELPLEYFRWRQEENHAVAADVYCSHVMLKSGADRAAVPRILEGMGVEEKVELMQQNSFTFGEVPAWQRRGTALRLAPAQENGQPLPAFGKMTIDLEVPEGDAFSAYLRAALLPPELAAAAPVNDSGQFSTQTA